MNRVIGDGSPLALYRGKMGWKILEHVKDKPELFEALKAQFPGWKPDELPERKGQFYLKPETLEELTKEMRQKPHSPKRGANW